jgi:hypothetical protein
MEEYPQLSYSICDHAPVLTKPSKVPLTTGEVIDGLPMSLARCKDFNDVVLDAVLKQDYSSLFTKTRAQYVDTHRFERWSKNNHVLVPGIKFVPEEVITEEFLDRYYWAALNAAPDNIKNVTSVEYIRENADRFTSLRKIKWPLHVLTELEWNTSLYYSDDSIFAVAGARKKSARSAEV